MKKAMIITLALLLALGCFGCGKKNAADKTGDGTTPTIGETELYEPDIGVVQMTDSEKAEAAKKPPVAGVEYAQGEIVSYTYASVGTYTWNYDNGDGTSTGVCSDSVHPLQFADNEIATIQHKSGYDSAAIKFSKEPESFEVTCWSEECRGDNAQQYFDSGESVKTDADGTFQLHTDGKGYVYEIHATWAEGNVYYCFMVTA